MRRPIFFLMACCWLGITVNCYAQNDKWVWIKVDTLVNKYATFQGGARVNIDKDKFVADLFDKEHPDILAFTVKGAIKADKVTATVIVHGSDVPQRTYSGQYQKMNLKGHSIKVREIVTLTDGYHFIGISRAY